MILLSRGLASRAIAGLATLAVALAASNALAQPATEATRRELLDRAEHARAAGEHVQAIELATQAAALRMTPSVHGFLAQEHESLGHSATALSEALLCIHAYEADATLPNRDQVLASCRQIRTEVQPHVAHLTVRVPTPPPAGLHVRIGNDELNAALYNTAIDVDPGTVHVSATADGYAAFRSDATVASAGSAEVRIDLVAPASSAVPATTSSAHPGGSRPSIVLPIAVAGVGVVGLILAGVFYGLRGGNLATIDAMCDAPSATGERRCTDPAAAQGAYASANGFSTASTIGTVAGGVVLGVGLAWLIVTELRAPGSHEHARLEIVPHLGPNGVALTIGGAL